MSFHRIRFRYGLFFRKGFASARSFISALSVLSVIVAIFNVPTAEWLAAVLNAYDEVISEPIGGALALAGIEVEPPLIDVAVLYAIIAGSSLYLASGLSVHFQRTPYDGINTVLSTPEFILNPLFNSRWLIVPFAVLFFLLWPIGLLYLLRRPFVFATSSYTMDGLDYPQYRRFLARNRAEIPHNYQYDLRLALLSTLAALFGLVLLTLFVNGITD